jgi:hypothetical protein
MSAVIFVGPTLPLEIASHELNATYFPPAAQGDIYRASLRTPPPRVIGLIDGYFRQQPAVRHKEILWAMAQGIHVFGAASMGALRAAELADFGMIGVGRIFESLKEGTLEDDDEVAIDHGPAETGYLQISDALVDMRAAFKAAVFEGIIDKATEPALADVAKGLFFSDRTYAAVLTRARQLGFPKGEMNELDRWLRGSNKGQKRDDALRLLATMREFLETNPAPKKVDYVFEATETWDRDIAFLTALGDVSEAGNGDEFARKAGILDEFQLAPGECKAARQEAFMRALVLRESRRQQIQVTDGEIDAARRKWCEDHGLHTTQHVWEWRHVNHLDELGFAKMIREEAVQARLEAMASEIIDSHLIDALRRLNFYPSLVARGLAKGMMVPP